MNDLHGELNPLNMLKTGNFVIDRVSHTSLHDPEGKFDQKFLVNLGTALSNTPLSNSIEGSFAYNYIFTPSEMEEKTNRNVVIKMFKPERLKNPFTPQDLIDEAGLNKLFYSKDFILFTGKNKYEDLNTEELNFLRLASVHKRYEELFGEYVLPSVFLTYKTNRDIVTEDTAYNFPDSQYRNEGRLTLDGRRILYKAGETVYAVIQDFQKLRGPVHNMKVNLLTPLHRNQIKLFKE